MIAQQGTLEISRSRLAHNLRLLRGRVGQAKICATIKADAYGHGVDLLADLLREEGLEWACVYSLQEALDLARFCPFKLLVLAPLVLYEAAPNMIQHVLDLGGMGGGGDGTKWETGVRFNITDAPTARFLSQSVITVDKSRCWPVHVQVDAGLTRMGTGPGEVGELIALINELPGLQLEGIFAHLSHGDVPGHATVAQQLAVLHRVADPVKKAQPGVLVHMQNSAGALHLGDAGLDLVRIGIALYGLQPSTAEPIPGLQPIARVTAPVLAIHERPAGTGVGYGHSFVTQRPSRLAIVPVGYADGYPRQLSNRSVAQIRGQDMPVVGRVSMDQIIVDVTDLPPIAVGEEATVISWDPAKKNCLDQMADAIGTIGYELATHLGGRLRRVVAE